MTSTSIDFSLDGSEWGLDDTSQDLLNEAIASNYRSREIDGSMEESGVPRRTTSKRKPSKSSSATTSSSSGGKRGYDKTEGASKTAAAAPKRAGRKPLEKPLQPETSLDPKQKRKEQNRAAQRAFRERKERHVSELQDRIRELEEENSSHSHLLEENMVLKDQVKQLKEENYALKGTAFTFEYPAKTLSHDEEYRSSNSSSSNSSCGSLSISGSAADKMSSNSENSSSSSSSSSVKSGESPAMASAGDTPEDEHQSTPGDLQSTITPYPTPQLLLDITDDLLMPGDDSHNYNFFNPTPIVDFSNSTLSSATAKLPQGRQQYQSGIVAPATTGSTGTQRHDLVFTDYRVPPAGDGFLFQNDSELPPLFGEELDLFGFSAPAPFVNNNNELNSGVPGGQQQQQQQDLLTQLADPNFLLHTSQDEQTQALLQHFHHQQQEPFAQGNGEYHQLDSGNARELLLETLHEAQRVPRKAKELQDEIKTYCPDFDLEDLCADLKEKATCADRMFTPNDVNEIIDFVQRKDEGKFSYLQQQ